MTAEDGLVALLVWVVVSAFPLLRIRADVAARREPALSRWRAETALFEAGARAVHVRVDAPAEKWVWLAMTSTEEQTLTLSRTLLLDAASKPPLVGDDGRRVVLADGRLELRAIPSARSTRAWSSRETCFDDRDTHTFAIEVPGGTELWIRGVPRDAAEGGAIELAAHRGSFVIAAAPDGLVPAGRPVEPAGASPARIAIAAALPLLPFALAMAWTRGTTRELATSAMLALMIATVLFPRRLARWALRA